MLQFENNDLEIYAENLKRRKKSFRIETKRNEKKIFIDGKRVAKLRTRNTMTPLERDESVKILNVFASVKKSINKYLIQNDFDIPKIKKKYDSSFRNHIVYKSLPDGTEFIYVDAKHCYWRIAYLMGLISPYYYQKILDNPEMKLYRNMALSCIIAPKIVDYIYEGKLINTIKEDTSIYEQVYENIRFTAWNLFGKLAFEKIGKENCIGYFTDGIMVFEKDLRTVKMVLARHQIQYRIQKCKKINAKEFIELESGEVKRF